MRIGIAALILAYVLSQFYRAFLAVLSPVLKADLGVSAADLASASGWWFLAFAAIQVPIGLSLDRIGPRLTAGVLMAVGACGALLFAQATGAGQIKIGSVARSERLAKYNQLLRLEEQFAGRVGWHGWQTVCAGGD